jgi:hypothetical protein
VRKFYCNILSGNKKSLVLYETFGVYASIDYLYDLTLVTMLINLVDTVYRVYVVSRVAKT